MRAFAHRGGATHPDLVGLENTLRAFRHAHDLGYRWLETDVHATSDGVLVAFHDDGLDRVTDRSGRIRDLTWSEVGAARVQGEPIPRMADLVEAFPDAHWNVDLKSDESVQPMVDLIEAHRAHDRFTVATFSPTRLARFRRLSGGRVPTAAHTFEVIAFRFLPGALARRINAASALQIPVTHRGLTVLTDRLLNRAHRAGVEVHVWTIDESADMIDLINRGVDGIFTDRTDTLRAVLVEHGLWTDPGPPLS